MDKIIRISFSLGVFCIFIGAVVSIQHWPGGDVISLAGWFIYSIFVLCALIEYHKIAVHHQLAKIILFGTLGLIYAGYTIITVATFFTDVFELLPWTEYYLNILSPVFLFGGIVYMLSFRKKLIYIRKPGIVFDFDKDRSDM